MCELSIIVPVYNVGEWLEQCLDSILAQTWRDFEVICVDDGSTDNSPLILEKYKAMDERIKIIHKENGGLVSARKAGVSEAGGKYTAYVDSDDWIEEGMYQRLMEKALETNADIVTSGLILEYPDGRITELEEMEPGEYSGRRLEEVFYPNMISTEEFFVQRVSMHIFNKIYKTELLKGNQLRVPDKITIFEDAACVYPCLLEARKIVVLHQAFYHYRMRESSMMGTCSYEKDCYQSVYSYLSGRMKEFPYGFLQRQLEMLIIFLMLMLWPDALWKGGNLVPYEDLGKGKIVLYGMGRFGKAFKKAIEQLEGYEIAALVDENRKSVPNGEKCFCLKEFAGLGIDYDYVLVAVLKRNICRNVKKELLAAGIEEKKIREPSMEKVREAAKLFM